MWYMQKREQYTAVALHNVRSAHNVGSVFRTADGAGVDEVFLIGYTPTPIDRFGRRVGEVHKTALGAEESMPHRYYATDAEFCAHLKERGIDMVVVEQHAWAQNYTTYTPGARACYVFGNEVDGVPSALCERADAVIDITMHGAKESLNVGVSVGVILFGLR